MKRLYLLLLFIIFICVGCQVERKSVSMQQFQELALAHDYQFFDVTDDYKNNKRVIEAGMIATTVWHTEYYILDTTEHAEEMFLTNKDFFKEQKKASTSYFEDEKKEKNYQFYSLTTNHAYMYISRIDNTILYIHVPVEYHRKVKNIAKELEY